MKKIASGAALMIILNLVIKPFWILGIDRSVQNILGAEEYGAFFSVFNFAMLFFILLDFGITNYNARTVASTDNAIKNDFSALFVLKILLGIFYLIVILSGGFSIGYGADKFWMITAVGINVFLSSMVQFLRSNFAGLQMFKTDSILSIIDKTLVIVFCAIIIWAPFSPVRLSIKTFILTQMLASSLTSVICLILLFPHLHKFSISNISFAGFYQRIKSSFPYALLSLLMAFYLKTDGVMIERLLPDGALQSGIYAASFRLYDASVAVVLMLGAVLMPAFSHQLAKGQSIEKTLKSALTFAFVLYSSSAVVTVFYADDFMPYLYQENTVQSALILKILMFGSIISSQSYILGALLTAGGHLRLLNVSALSGALVNISLNFLMIPIYKATGSALATFFTQMCLLIIQWSLSAKFFKLSTNYVFIGKCVLFLSLSLGLGFGLKTFLEMFWIWKMLLTGILIFGLIFALKLIDINNIKAIFKK